MGWPNLQTHLHPNGFQHKLDSRYIPQTTQEFQDMFIIPYTKAMGSLINTIKSTQFDVAFVVNYIA